MTLSIASPTAFAQQLLADLGAPQTPNNVAVVTGWENVEGGNWNNSAAFNPLNTSQLETGSVNYSSGAPGSGVQRYTSWLQGLQATVQTLTSPADAGYGYPAIVSDLQANAPESQTAQAIVNSSWDAGHYGYNPGSILGSGSASGPTAPVPASAGATASPAASIFGVHIPGTGSGGPNIGPNVVAPLSAAANLLNPSTYVGNLKAYLADSVLVVMGLIAVVVGLVVIAKASGGSGKGSSASQAPGGGSKGSSAAGKSRGGSDKPPAADGKAEGGAPEGAGEAAGAAEVAVLA